MITKFKLFESPDEIKINNTDKIYWFDLDAVVFGYGENGMEVGPMKNRFETHLDLPTSGRYRLKYAGRLWYEKQYITFWDYPKDYTELKKVLKDIVKKLSKFDINIELNDDWNIEVVVDDGEQVFPKTKRWNNNANISDDFISEFDEDVKTKIIKVGDYIGSAKRSASELAMQHVKIGNGGAIDGWGSKSFNKIPKGMTPAQYKDTKTKYKYTEGYDNKI